MVHFTATIEKFEEKGDKTGWTYITISKELAQELKPGNKKAFRVQGFLDAHPFKGISLIPMGGGDFIMALNATVRKQIKKGRGDLLKVKLEVDTDPVKPPPELLECLEDEPDALHHFNTLPPSHQNYFTRWINEAKTEPTKAKRIAQALNALKKGIDFGAMIRSISRDNNALYGLKEI
jgi:hypothetical protein